MKKILFFCFWLSSLFIFSQDIVWEKSFNKSRYNQFGCIRSTSDGGCILGSDFQSDYQSDTTFSDEKFHKLKGYKVWIIKLDSIGNTEWEKTYGNSNHEYFEDIQQTSDGGYILLGVKSYEAGRTETEGAVWVSNAWIVKLNSNGNIEWEKIYPESQEHTDVKIIQQTKDGGFLLGGTKSVYDTNSVPQKFNSLSDKIQFYDSKKDFYVCKINSKGEIQWRNTYGGIKADYLTCIYQLPGEGYLLGGFSDSNRDTKNKLTDEVNDLLIKIDKKGKIQWEKSYRDSTNSTITDIQPSQDGGYLLGERCSQQGRMSDFGVLKVNSKFQLQWKKYYGGSKADVLLNILPTPDGAFLLAGYTNSSDGDVKSGYRGNGDYWLVKINAQGDILWERTYGSSTNERLGNIQRASNGGYLLGGTTGHFVGPLDGDHRYNYSPEKITESMKSDVKSKTKPKTTNIWVVKVKE